MIHHILSIDTGLFCLINSHHSVIFDYFFLVVTQFGNGWIAVPLIGIIIVIVSQKKYLAKALICAAVVGIVAGIANTQVKNALNRPRPLAYFCDNSPQKGTFTVHVVGEPLRRHSFPSGHALTVFAAAAILAFLYGGRFWWAFAPALLIAYSRIYVGAHFPLDVLGGMAAGAGIAALCFLPARLLNIVPRRVPLRGTHA